MNYRIELVDGHWFIHFDDGNAQGPYDDYQAALSALAAVVEQALQPLATEPPPPEMQGQAFHAWVDEGEQSVDGRILDANSVNFNRPPPLPWMVLTENEFGPPHTGAQLAGVIDRVERDGSRIHVYGRFDPASEAGIEGARLLNDGMLDTWSPDLADTTIEIEMPATGGDIPSEQPIEGGIVISDDEEIMHLLDGTIIGGTFAPFPALTSAKVEPDAGSAPATTPPVETPPPAETPAPAQATTETDALSASLRGFASRGGIEAISNERMAEVAAATPIEVPPDGTMAGTISGHSISQPIAPRIISADRSEIHWAAAPLIAAASPRPNAEWFQDHGLPPSETGYVTVDPETRRVYGYVAPFGVCHIGHPEACVTAPESPTNYAYFRTGEIDVDNCDCGSLAVGTITMDTGHASLSSDPSSSIRHYDDTGTAVAYVATGENEWGVWHAGVLAPGVTAEQIARLKAANISGDWRRIGGSLELVAALAVNTGGFPITRAHLAASGHQTALVAAGSREMQAILLASGARIDEVAFRRLERLAPVLESMVEERTQGLRSDVKGPIAKRLREEVHG